MLLRRITQCLRLRHPCNRLRWRWPLSRLLLTESMDGLAAAAPAAAAPTLASPGLATSQTLAMLCAIEVKI